MTGWGAMGRDQFDRKLGTARERRMAARLRDQPDTLLPELAEVQLTDRKATPAAPQLDGQDALFSDGL